MALADGRLLGEVAGAQQRLADLERQLPLVAREAAREMAELGVVPAVLAHAVEPAQHPARDPTGGDGSSWARAGPSRAPSSASTASSWSSTEPDSAGRPPSRATASATRSGWWEPIGSRRATRPHTAGRERARSQAVDALRVVLEASGARLLELRRLEPGRRIAQHRVAGRLPDAQLEPLDSGERGRRGELDERADHRRHHSQARSGSASMSARSAGPAGTAASALAVGGEDDGDRILARARALGPSSSAPRRRLSPSRSLRRAVACGGASTRPPPRACPRGSSLATVPAWRDSQAGASPREGAGGVLRDSTREEAERREVKGWVKNRDDGSVEAVFEGEPDMVEHMVWFVGTGPGSSECRARRRGRRKSREDRRGFKVT